MDSACLLLAISRKQRVIDDKTNAIHDKKLFQLGICPIRHHLNPELVIRNLSDRILNRGEIDVLMLGLDFELPVEKLNFFSYYLCFEKMAKRLHSETVFDGGNEFSSETLRNGCKMIP